MNSAIQKKYNDTWRSVQSRIKNRLLPCGLGAFCLTTLTLACSSVQAAPVTLNFSSDISFSPNSIVASGGQSLGNVLQQSFGIDSSTNSSFTVTGSLVYEANTIADIDREVMSVGISGNVGGYSNSVSSLNLTIAGSGVDADIDAINANADSASSGFYAVASNFGLLNPEIGGSSIQTVQSIFPNDSVQTGNAALIGDNLPVAVTGPSGTTPITTASDFIGFSIGTTGINDFGAGFNTDAGELALSSFALIIIGNGTQDLFSGTGLPADDSFYHPDNLDTAIIALALELENGFAPLRFNAEITSFDIQVSEVPVPAAAWLFGSSLLGLCVARKRLR